MSIETLGGANCVAVAHFYAYGDGQVLAVRSSDVANDLGSAILAWSGPSPTRSGWLVLHF